MTLQDPIHHSIRYGLATPLLLVVTLLSAPTLSSAAPPLPTGGNVALGNAAIFQAGNQMTISQNSGRAVINWNTFDVGQGNQVIFNQPSASSAVLNRVLSSNPSAIQGMLQSNGKLYLINQNGILVGSQGVINAGGGFIGSTLDVNMQNATTWYQTGGELRFTRENGSTGTIENNGRISSASGNVFLISDYIINTGRILATNGQVGLIAGADEIRLVDSTNPSLVVSLGGNSAGGTGIDNQGDIEATKARLEAVQGNIYALAINNEGSIRANSAHVTENGEVFLTAGDRSNVHAAGHIEASNSSGTSGNVDIQGGKVELAAHIESAGDVHVSANNDIEITGLIEATDKILLNANDGITEVNTAIITGELLKLTGTGNFLLQSPSNNVDRIVANVDGALSYWDADDLTVAYPGIVATGDITLKTGGLLTSYLPISGRNMMIDSQGGARTYGRITAQDLLVVGRGNFSIENRQNDIYQVAANIDGSLKIYDRNSLIVGSAFGFNGITTTGSASLTAVDMLTVMQPVQTGNNLKLHSRSSDVFIAPNASAAGDNVSVFAGRDIYINGIVFGFDILDVFAAENIHVGNTGIAVGNYTFMSAENDIHIEGGNYGSTLLYMLAGDDIIVHQNGIVGGNEVLIHADDNVGIAGLLYAYDLLSIYAGHDIDVFPSGFIAADKATLTALNDVEISGGVFTLNLLNILAYDDFEVWSTGSVTGGDIIAVAVDDIHVDGEIQGHRDGTILAIAGEDFTLRGGTIDNRAGPIILAFDTRNAPFGIYGDGEFRMDAASRIGATHGSRSVGPIMIFGTTARIIDNRWVSNLDIADGAVIGGIAYNSRLGAMGYLSDTASTWRAHFPFLQWKHQQYGWDLNDLCLFAPPPEVDFDIGPIDDIVFIPPLGFLPELPFEVPAFPFCSRNPELTYSDPFTFFFHGPGLDAWIWDTNMRQLSVDRFERIPMNLFPPSRHLFRYGKPRPRRSEEITGASSYDFFRR